VCIKAKSLEKFHNQKFLSQIKIRGEAESFAIHAKAKAEAEQMAKKAEAYKEYREAAMVEMLLETLPKVRIIKKNCFIFSNLFFSLS
jgi:uncharacterized membrane protein YqiK